jgi:hypothetical protein
MIHRSAPENPNNRSESTRHKNPRQMHFVGRLLQEALDVYDNSGKLLSGETPQLFDLTPANTGTTLGVPNAYLGGPDYIWFTVWQNGFANDSLAIDNVTATPEPASLALLGVAGVGTLLVLRRRKQPTNA